MKSVHYLGWDRPLCQLVAQFIHTDPQLLQSTIIVPTKESGVRLKTEILRQSESNGCFIPNIIPINVLYEHDLRIDTTWELSAWVDTLLNIDTHDYPHLFPTPPLCQDIIWASNLGKKFLTVQSSFDEFGILQERVIELANIQSGTNETLRWENWYALKSLVDERIHQWGFKTSAEHLEECLHRLSILNSFSQYESAHIVLAGLPELSPWAEQYFQSCLNHEVKLSILVNAPQAAHNHFDSWGRPQSDFWTESPIPIKNKQIQLLQDSYLVADQTCEWTAKELMKQSVESVCLGACSQELPTLINDSFIKHGWQLYNPAGVPFTHSGLYSLIQLLADHLEQPQDFRTFYQLAQSSILAYSFQSLATYYDCVKAMDELKGKHLPETINYILVLLTKHSPNQVSYATQLHQFLLHLNEPHCIATHLRAWLLMLKELDWNDGFQGKAVDLLIQLLDKLTLLQEKAPHWANNAVIIKFLLTRLANAQIMVAEESGDVLKINSWLELAYCTEESMIITGMYEGCVPEGKPDDSLLPETFKQALGLPCLKTTTARDSYLLSAMVMGRKKQGNLHFLLSKLDVASDPIKPSRLLMRCSDKELATRIQLLFGEASQFKSTLKYNRGNWILSDESQSSVKVSTQSLSDLAPHFVNPWADPNKTFSPSLLKNYLGCPLRFWLTQIFHLPSDNRPSLELHSMAANSSGTFIHEVLAEFTQLFPSAESLKPREEMQSEMNRIIAIHQHQFLGDDLLLPVAMQLQSIKKRLSYYIRHHIEQLEAGWQCIAFEQRCTLPMAYEDETYCLTMVIDRIDQHPELGYRIIDYKTGKFKPFTQSCLTRSTQETLDFVSSVYPNYQPFIDTSKTKETAYLWKDLQLPLYTQWAKNHYKDPRVQAGYCNLPASTEDIGFNMWTDLTEGAQQDEAAFLLARDIMHHIRHGSGIYSYEELAGKSPQFDLFKDLAPDSIWDMVGMKHEELIIED